MNKNISRTFLDFERPIGELMAQVDELRLLSDKSDINITNEINRLEDESRNLTDRIFSKLTPWQKTLLSRHPDRPYASDYLQTVFTGFRALHGDRTFADDKAIIGGLTTIDGMDVMVISQEKGRGTKERVLYNFGMPRPEG